MIEKVINFGLILDGFRMDFGTMLVDFWHHFSSSISNRFPRGIQDLFGGFGPPTRKARGDREVDFCNSLGNLLALGAVFGPNWPQEASRIPPRGLLEPILKDSGPNLVDFGSQFGGFWMDFASDFH